MIDPIELTRALLAFDTTNPPGHEAQCARFVACELESAGLHVHKQTFADQRINVVAQIEGADSEVDPLVLTGHLDTVPLGSATWSMDPFAGETREGRLYGRGASDMKAAVAAMIAVAQQCAQRRTRLKRGLTLIFTSGEETGCIGARALAERAPALLGKASAMIVGEPSGNRLAVGHKGCLALKGRTRGKTAHSSMPEQGRNAIYAAARAISRLEDYAIAAPRDVVLGMPTLNVGIVAGGLNYNSVPDAAEFTVDVRSTSGISHDAIQAQLTARLGEEIELERFVDMPAVVTPIDDRFVAVAQQAMASIADADATPLTMPFYSDASILTPHLRCPTILLGPGEPSMAHQTDEYCAIEAIRVAVELYSCIIAKWCGRNRVQ